ncbi:hypothetical protein [Haloferula sp.]|uniref:hypothetical protein n=1 Tax=Haloferula sp. TaxID=2497595 RepID=UPI003C761586
MEAFIELSKKLDADGMRSLADTLRSDSQDNPFLDQEAATFMLGQLLPFVWASKDPASALQWAGEKDPFIEKDELSRISLRSWALKDPAAAIAWARENFNENDHKSEMGNELLVGVIEGMSVNDFAGATELTKELINPHDVDSAISALLPVVWANGESAVMDWATSLPEGLARDAALRSVSKSLAEEDFDRAARWVDGMDESGLKVEIVEEIGSIGARKDPAMAAEWLSNMPAGKARAAGLERVVSSWVQTDPRAVSEWLVQIPQDQSNDGAIAIFCHEIAKADPQGALSWASMIEDPTRRKKSVKYVNSVSRNL